MKKHLWTLGVVFLTLICVAAVLVMSDPIRKFFVVPRNQEPHVDSEIDLEKAWCSSFTGLIVTQIGTNDKFVYVRTGDAIVALSQETGTLVWTFAIEDDTWRVPPVLFNDSVIVASKGTDAITRLNAITGQVIWTTSEPVPIATDAKALSVGASNLYILWHNYGLVSYDAITSKRLWSSKVGGGRTHGLLVSDNIDNVYVSESETLTALDKFGQVLWEYTGSDSIKGLTLANELVYFYESNELRAISTADGSLRWKVPILGKYRAMPVGSHLLIPGRGGQFVAVDVETGAIQWHVSLPASAALQTPAFYNDRVYVESLESGRIYSIELSTGSQVGVIQVQAQTSEPNAYYGVGPTSNGGNLLVPSGNVLCAFH